MVAIPTKKRNSKEANMEAVKSDRGKEGDRGRK